MEDPICKKRVRDDSDEFGDGSPEVKRLREDLLDDLDLFDLCTAENQDLESFMKSFEEEISPSPSQAAAAETVIDLTSESGDSRPDLGFLLCASDDELGLPPAGAQESENSELIRVSSDSAELAGGFWDVDGQIPSLDSFAFVDSGCEYDALDGLFDSDLSFGSGDSVWRPETLPAD
ncbi:unnamed protein product [Cuscuta campestris]|uniref:Uncharacterized protein n=1 Tax=Cuscuta campestris TaxID=132261 RepID=A0A484LNX9_9ASTE|nr:unnamed protein product [Cuscuta campestris]